MGAGPEVRVVHSRDPDDVDALLRRVARGESKAFESLYDVMCASVYGVARRVVRDPSRAEDVTQDAFLDIWRKAPGFDAGRGSAKTWIMTIAHRRAVDAVRRNESAKKYDRATTVQDVSNDEPADAVIKGQEHSAVRGCLDTLTQLQLESVRLAYFNGYTYSEVATLLGKPLPTIKTRMRDGLTRLRDCLEGPDDHRRRRTCSPGSA
jgi:RNA polymerase sigma-70 factor (ECF subfamily)